MVIVFVRVCAAALHAGPGPIREAVIPHAMTVRDLPVGPRLSFGAPARTTPPFPKTVAGNHGFGAAVTPTKPPRLTWPCPEGKRKHGPASKALALQVDDLSTHPSHSGTLT